MQSIKTTQSWQNLKKLSNTIAAQHMRDYFRNEPNRFKNMSLEACGIFLDYSKNRVTQEVLDCLFNMAREQHIENKISNMFDGHIINETENRAVLHTALRNFSGSPVYVDGQDVMPSVLKTLKKMETFTHSVHSGQHKGFTGKPFKTIVSIGIGGSFLGPKIVTEALKPFWTKHCEIKFVANVDGCHIQDILQDVDRETTLFVMSSKSFGTQETLQNTMTAKTWFLENGATEKDIAKHFVAVSSNVKAATEFGMDSNNVFPMWDWVGGRYSLWSAIGLPISLTIGFDRFRQILEGAFDMDMHFREAPLEKNMPVIMALLGVWYRNFMGAQSHALLPYYHYLRGFPAYVQQLDMESNGKSCSITGEFLNYETGPIIWGSEGTNGQHSFHQLIHQSQLVIPVDFLFPLTVTNQDDTHHSMLASNCFGQSQAMMQGKTFEECYADLKTQISDDQERKKLAAHKTMPGNKPSNTLLFSHLDPKTLGSLVALYEHKVFVQGAIWGLNSFDQWGVELGKVLGNQVLDMIADKTPLSGDSSTKGLVHAYKKTLAKRA